MHDFIDLQINGYGGLSFNQDELDPAALHRVCQMLRQHEVRSILATVTTDSIDKMCLRLGNLTRARENDPLIKDLIIGFHVEGPFLNETDGYRGAHPRDAIRPADVESMKQLLEAGAGLVRMVTLAPERDAGFRIVSMLAKQGIRISAGHTDASTDELRGAIDAGLSMFTHLGNGCPMQMHRHDNIIHRVLSVAD